MVFGVETGKFLGYMVNHSGIKANPDQIKPIQEIKIPTKAKELQKLARMATALKRYISKSSDGMKPFFQLLRKKAAFEWGPECTGALQDLKKYLSTPPFFSTPEPRKELYLYLAVTNHAGRFRGNLLAATEKYGNQENQDNRHWFLEHLSTTVSPERNITFVSDRNLGLVEVLPKVFPMAFYAYCLYHLKMNLRYHLRGMFRGLKEKLITLFRKCAYAPTEETFHQCLVELKTEGGSRVEKLSDDIPHDH
ncbi:uncharacterized protein LOC114323044 [Camellia sinensis]|uniref:uncharacterized protein LOC114323044 n=1 Tax=Camellia sinensis TaxID=4442 RepID=UPI001035C914|nr:uncharacterized protein LOC114323044 [Camellia sinensis]